jgi:hypothetical protein
MAIVNTAARILPGFGIPAIALQKNASLTVTATTTQAVPAPGISSGYVRVKFSGPNALTTGVFNITVDDGVTTYEIYPTSVVTAAGNSVDLLIPFCVDIHVLNVNVIATLAGSTHTGTLDIEVCGNP